MIQINTICISEPYIPTDYEISKHSLFVMECNVRRMKHMIEWGYFCREYSEDEWQNFKGIKRSIKE